LTDVTTDSRSRYTPIVSRRELQMLEIGIRDLSSAGLVALDDRSDIGFYEHPFGRIDAHGSSNVTHV
jgi:hypothetical protein